MEHSAPVSIIRSAGCPSHTASNNVLYINVGVAVSVCISNNVHAYVYTWRVYTGVRKEGECIRIEGSRE